MTGQIKYFVLKKYQGRFFRKHKGNIHLFFIPIGMDIPWPMLVFLIGVIVRAIWRIFL